MRHIIQKTLPAFFALAALSLGCSKPEPELEADFEKYKEALKTESSETDAWIAENITKPYNIDVIWRYTDTETDYGYNIIPPYQENVVPFMKVLDDVFIKSYIDIYQNSRLFAHPGDFIRTYVPKQIHLLGEWAYGDNGVRKLGQAEGGRKIILYGINYWQDTEQLGRFLHTMFHEFSHILHQNKLYPETYEKVTPEGYTAQWFNPQDDEGLRFKISREQGFVSDYARMNKDEDFVETLTYYLVLSDEGWNQLLGEIDGSEKAKEAAETAKNEGKTEEEQQQIAQATAVATTNSARAALREKQSIINDYLKSSWDIDFDQLHSIVQSRMTAAFGNLDSYVGPRAAGSGLTAIDKYVLQYGMTGEVPGAIISEFTCDGAHEHLKYEGVNQQ